MRLLYAPKMPPPNKRKNGGVEEEQVGRGDRGVPRPEAGRRRRSGMRRQRRWRRLRPSNPACSAIAALCLVGGVSAGTCEYSTLLEEVGGSHEVTAGVSHTFSVPPSDDDCPQGETETAKPVGGHHCKERRTSEVQSSQQPQFQWWEA